MSDEELEKLIALAKSGEGTAEPVSDVEEFVLAKGIKEGDTKIIPYQVWMEYVKWARKPVGRRIFFRQFRKLFKPHRWGTKRFYKLDPSAFDMSKDAYWKMRAAIREERAGRKKYGRGKKEDEI